MLNFIHGYHPELWDAQINSGLVNPGDGIRFCQSKLISEHMKFNSLAAKGTPLYRYLAENPVPFYIDRLQGGCYIDDYVYDSELTGEYRRLLGDNFWGFQMHEWLSNYRSDIRKLSEPTPCENWTPEGIEADIFKKFPFPCLFLECMTAEEMASFPKPQSAEMLYRNMTAIYAKRVRDHGDLIPCDSAFLAYPFEFDSGAKRVMPEVGAQTPDARVQICFARGEAHARKKSFGVYYETWGGDPFSTCCYQKDERNEWGIGESADFPFSAAGPNGGSSRSLQKRIFLYSLFSNAEFLSEEWGLCNVFVDWHDFELSPYGLVKKEFIDFIKKYSDIGEKLAPIAAVLPGDFRVLEEIHSPQTHLTYPTFGSEGKKLAKIKDGICKIFSAPTKMLGTETATLINSHIPDAVDLLTNIPSALKKYDYLVDLSGEEKLENTCEISEIPQLLKKLLPCYVHGGLHWTVNRRTGGGFYLAVFNHSGVCRSVEEGEYVLPGSEVTAA
ncbi:MAG: hypothetical protein IKZ19_09165, partial [Clostridia bacterium]|nr:hypothetical protein [Clostridia bacterium]